MSSLIISPNVLDIASDDDPYLRIRASEVDTQNIADNVELQQLIADMIVTMHSAKGIGLAAPQVRRSLRMMVFYLPASRDDVCGRGVPLTVLINPVINFPSQDCNKVVDFEGCLSVPGMRGKVARANKIQYSGVDEHGQSINREAEGWHARLIQHEYDHLEGILYTDLMDTDDALLTVDEWRTLMRQT